MVDKHRGVRLLEQDMKVYEKSLEKKLKDIVTIDDKQFALQSCKSTVDANFVLRQLQEKFGTKELFLSLLIYRRLFIVCLKKQFNGL